MAQLTSLLSRPGVWLAFGGLALLLGLLAWRLHLRWLPAWLLRLGLVGLVLLGAFWPNQGAAPQGVPARQVLVVDQSDSLSVESREQTWRQALAWQAGGENRLVVAFGVQPVAVLPEKSAPASANAPAGGPALKLDGRASDLAGALRLAGSLIGDSAGTPSSAGATGEPEAPATSEPGRIILASDGLASQPAEVSRVVSDLAHQGLRLDVIPLASRQKAGDLALGGLAAPANLWSGMPFDLLVPVYGAEAGTPVQLSLAIDGQPSEIQAEPLEANNYRFHIPSLPEGIAALQVTVDWPAGASGEIGAQKDSFPGNNSAYAVLKVFAAPPVLFVSGDPEGEAARGFLDLLTRNHIPVSPVRPESLPTGLDALQQYRVIILHNLLSSQLSREQMTALQVFVSRQAGGLVFLGGRNSYTLGGYQDSQLEPLLPVKLEPPPRSLRPPMVFELILDRSSSMGNYNPLDQTAPPIGLAREAAMRTIETLKAEDYLGVLTFSDDPHWDFPLQPIGGALGMRQALDSVSRVSADGSTYMFAALQEALTSMAALPADAPSNRHILLLSDGQSTDGEDPDFIQLAQSAQAMGITVSAIALGEDANTELMTQMAAAGKGRFYAVKDAADLPRIMIAESQAARSENVQTGQTSLKIASPGHPILSGISQKDLPLLNGYNALRSKAKEGAEDILISGSFDDPILSTWQYGLGRVSAWTGDLGEEWTRVWSEATAGQFWSQVVRYSLADPAGGPAQVHIGVDAANLQVDANIYTPQGDPLNLSSVTLTYADPAPNGDTGQTHTFRLSQQSAGAYHLEIPRPADGAYRAVLSYTDEKGQKAEIAAPFAVNPPREWLPEDPAAGQANGAAALAAWARTTGGGTTVLEQAPQEGEAKTEQPFVPTFDAWQRLMLGLVLLWPVEIAIRRRWLPWM